MAVLTDPTIRRIRRGWHGLFFFLSFSSFQSGREHVSIPSGDLSNDVSGSGRSEAQLCELRARRSEALSMNESRAAVRLWHPLLLRDGGGDRERERQTDRERGGGREAVAPARPLAVGMRRSNLARRTDSWRT